MKTLYLIILIALCACTQTTQQPNKAPVKSAIAKPGYVWVGKFIATDPEGARLRFRIIKQSEKNLVEIDNNGDMFVSQQNYDHRLPRLKQFTVDIAVSDGVNEVFGLAIFGINGGKITCDSEQI